MASESDAAGKPEPQKWHVRVNLSHSRRDHWAGGGPWPNPVAARAQGMIWAKAALEQKAGGPLHLDWVAPNTMVAIAYQGDQPLATVSSVPA